MLENLERNVVTVISHPRSGTHLTIDFLRKNFVELYSEKQWWHPLDYLYLPLDILADTRISEQTKIEKINLITRMQSTPIAKLHTYSIENIKNNYQEAYHWISNHKTIFVVRHPVHTLLSLHEYMKIYLPQAKVPFSEFIRQPYAGYDNRVRYWNAQVSKFLSDNSFFILRFEDLLNKTQGTGHELSHFLELPGSESFLLPHKPKNRFYNWLNRFHSAPESSAIFSYKQKLRSSSASIADVEFIKREASDSMHPLDYQ